MREEIRVRFLVDDNNKACTFVCRAPLHCRACEKEKLVKQNPGSKFCQTIKILDSWYITGGTKWSRVLFRLKHPIVYSKRGLNKLWRKIKYTFIKKPPSILCHENMDKDG